MLIGHTEGLTHLDSKDDGRYLLSNCKDQTARLWDIRKVAPLNMSCRARDAVRDGAEHASHDNNYSLRLICGPCCCNHLESAPCHYGEARSTCGCGTSIHIFCCGLLLPRLSQQGAALGQCKNARFQKVCIPGADVHLQPAPPPASRQDPQARRLVRPCSSSPCLALSEHSSCPTASTLQCILAFCKSCID